MKSQNVYVKIRHNQIKLLSQQPILVKAVVQFQHYKIQI